MRHKLDVLERACDLIQRDPAEITKTKLGGLLIAEDEAGAQRKLSAYAARRGVTEEVARNFAIAGTPESVLEQIEEYLEAGLDGLVFNMPDAYDLEPVALAGETLAARLGSRSAV